MIKDDINPSWGHVEVQSLIRQYTVSAIYNDFPRRLVTPKWEFSEGIPPKTTLDQVKDLEQIAQIRFISLPRGGYTKET